MGSALPWMCGACIVYWAFGQYLPSPLNHRGYGYDQIITHLSYGTEGFYGVPIYVSATYIFLFILFGSFLERAGMIKLFTDVSLGLFGGTRGGPGKGCCFASGMMGTISGSGVANVVTVGQFTIPLMIKFGYRRAFAAGVEATASMGGQIMPPVMGAVAFIMAENTRRSIFGNRESRRHPGDPLFRIRLLDGASGGRKVRPRRHEELAKCRAHGGRWSAAGFWCCRWPHLCSCCSKASRRSIAGSVGLGLTVALILGAGIVAGLFPRHCATFSGSALACRPLRSFALWRHRRVLGRRLVFVADSDLRADRAGWTRDAASVPRLARRQRQVRAHGRHRLRHRRHHHRHDDADRRRYRLRQRRSVSASNACSSLVMTMLLSIVLGTGLPTIPTYIIMASLAAPALPNSACR